MIINITQLKQENFFGRFYQLVLVNILSNIMVPLAGVVSVAFLGHLTEIYDLAGVAVATVIFNYLYRLLNFLRMGTTGVVAQAVGRDDRETMLLVLLRNGLIALVLGIAILILQHPMQQLWFALLNATPEVKRAGIVYFNARIWGASAVALNFVIIGWLLGLEKSTQVLWMTIVGNGANILLDYFFIARWGWGTRGAGLSACLSQYLTLLIGMIWVSREIQFQEIVFIAKRCFNWLEFQAAFALNGNIFIRILASRGTMVLFTSFSAIMGTKILAGNALMIELFLLSFSCMEGVGLAVETLIGNFKGKQENENVVPLVAIAVGTSFLIALAFSLTSILFPQQVFGLLTDHIDIIQVIQGYRIWLLPVLGFISIAYVLDGYFFGLADGVTPRNSALVGLLVGFTPIGVLAAWYFHSNSLLWLAFSMCMMLRATTVAIEFLNSLKTEVNVKKIAI